MANNFAFQENKLLVENDTTLTLKAYIPSFWNMDILFK